ncbi:MAG: entericidin [Gammaproteobacteria bacterium]|nr:entericidin [Gammaproteobacteria bacterium]
MKTIINLFFLINFFLLAACTNTLEGVGKDLEKIGKNIQDNIERVTEKEE